MQITFRRRPGSQRPATICLIVAANVYFRTHLERSHTPSKTELPAIFFGLKYLFMNYYHLIKDFCQFGWDRITNIEVI